MNALAILPQQLELIAPKSEILIIILLQYLLVRVSALQLAFQFAYFGPALPVFTLKFTHFASHLPYFYFVLFHISITLLSHLN